MKQPFLLNNFRVEISTLSRGKPNEHSGADDSSETSTNEKYPKSWQTNFTEDSEFRSPLFRKERDTDLWSVDSVAESP